MFKKILLAEDIDAVNKAVKEHLLKLGAEEVVLVQYCDEAYVKCKKAALNHAPFELIICDLSFKQDHRTEKISSGDQLAYKIKQELPETKVIIHTIEDQPARVKKIASYTDAYVCKGRYGLRYLSEAIEKVHAGENYISPDIRRSIEQQNVMELSEYDLSLLKYISQGFTQNQISDSFKDKGFAPSSKSAIEKRLKDLREKFGANTNAQLISLVITLQII